MAVTTDRLTIRSLNAADAPFVLELLNEPSFIRNIRDSQVRTIGDAERYIEDGPTASYARHGFGLMRVALKAADEPVGICGLLKRDTLEHPDIGFAFLERFCGQGYATEAAQAVMGHARDVLGLKTVAAITAPHNTASGRVLEKAGLRFVGMINPTGVQESRYYEWP
jgi:RimJ/RimL family protein N-acetyltransferase